MVDKAVLLRDDALHFPGLSACQLYQLLEMCRPDAIAPAPVPNALKSKGNLCVKFGICGGILVLFLIERQLQHCAEVNSHLPSSKKNQNPPTNTKFHT